MRLPTEGYEKELLALMKKDGWQKSKRGGKIEQKKN